MKTTLIAALLCFNGIAAIAGGPSSSNPDPLLVHEWGTFTSVQGADGIQLEWNPLTATELPSFVYDLNRPNAESPGAWLANLSSKSTMSTRQRMETPVIYFYSAQPVQVDVKVDFPEGVITEWYPQVTPATPGTTTTFTAKHKSIHWAGLQTMPSGASEDQTAHQSILPAPPISRVLPSDKSGSHYYAARETDSSVLKTAPGQKEEHEKFLFYRGVGSFEAPLHVSLTGQEAMVLHLKNTGPEAIGPFFILRIHQGQAQWERADPLGQNAKREITLNPNRQQMPLPAMVKEVTAAMELALVREGLYPKEAAAMVKTWSDSWLGERGVRVLYLLPRAWTDRTLPLTITPAPSQLARVMVGRAEVITPEMEWDLVKQVIRFTDGDEAARQRAANAVRAGLGRFAEPAMRHLQSSLRAPEFSKSGWPLLQAAARPAVPPSPTCP